MASEQTGRGIAFERAQLDLSERRFWRGIWESVPAEAAAEHGIELRDFGPVQATVVSALPSPGMMNLVLGATEPGAVADDHLAAAADWVASRQVQTYIPVTPGRPETTAAENWLQANGYCAGSAWMKFLRGSHPPRFAAPKAIEVIELSGPEQEPFGMIAATGFELPAWASTFFADLPGREGWRCYAARVDGRAQACGAMHLHQGIAHLGIGATLEPARGQGCQLALLRRRIVDAIAAGCQTFLIETGERVPGHPSSSYRNILRAGFEEAYLRPNWQRRP